MGFRTIARDAEHQETIKGSLFLGRAMRIGSREQAEETLTALRSEHEDANHVCFAYRVGAELRFSDDGEPGGTAGRPILEVIQRRELDHVLLTVTRWFGGTLLGAGGLVRAYSGTAAKTLDQAGEREVVDTVVFEVEVPFAYTDGVLRLLGEDPHVRAAPPTFSERGMAVVVTAIATEEMDVRTRLVDLTRGEANFIESS